MSQGQTRQQVARYLTEHGPLEDSNGRATAKLREAVGYGGSEANFTQLISNMDRSGEVRREVRGKRTFRIAAAGDDLPLNVDNSTDSAESAAMGSAGAGSADMGSADMGSADMDSADMDSADMDSADMDYDKVASALLIQVVQTLTQGPRGGENDGSWARRRIERLERRINELERELSQSKAESKTLTAERDELRLQLEHSEGNLALLTERLSTHKPREGHLSQLLGADERALLHQLRGSAVNKRPGRAS